MRRRPAREINIFNLSMLDVIASALGCFLILFIIAMQRQASAEQRAADVSKELEQLKRDMKDARRELSQQPSATPKALAKGMCNVPPGSVELAISDWSAEDGDEVRVHFNEKVVVPSLTLVATGRSQFPTKKDPFRLTLPLAAGVNELVIEALSNGTAGHNSARVVVKPCRNGREEEFKVDIDVTEALYPKTKTITIAVQ